MARTANVEETEQQRKSRLDALGKEVKTLEKALSVATTEAEKASITSQIETVKDEINPFRHSLSAGVTEGFAEAVRQAARKEGWTVQTYLRYHVEAAVGRQPVKPGKEVSEDYSLGVGVDRPTKEAIKEVLPDEGSMSQFLREVAAEASGWDLAKEPERVAPGEAMRKFQQKAKTQDTLVQKLWQSNPDIVRRMAADMGKSLAELGVTGAEAEAEDAVGATA